MITDEIKKTAAKIVAESSFVRIEDARLAAVADVLLPMPVPAWDETVHFFDGGVKSVMYYLVLDAANFCFWPSAFTVVRDGARIGEDDGYLALAAGFRGAFERGGSLWDPAFLAAMTSETLAATLGLEGELSLLDRRAANLRNLGETLMTSYGGDPMRLLASNDAPIIVEELAARFSCYADFRTWKGKRVPIMKRAQIVVSDIAGAFHDAGLGAFARLDQLTSFADYRLPQYLRSAGAFVYAADLDRRIRGMEEIAEDSPEEVEIRAATIHAVERLKNLLAARGRSVSSREVDWMLWNASVVPGAMSEPHHRTVTTSY